MIFDFDLDGFNLCNLLFEFHRTSYSNVSFLVHIEEHLKSPCKPSNGEIVDIKVKVTVEVERQRASWKARQFQTIHGVESPLRIMTKFQSQQLITFV